MPTPIQTIPKTISTAHTAMSATTYTGNALPSGHTHLCVRHAKRPTGKYCKQIYSSSRILSTLPNCDKKCTPMYVSYFRI